ncbi:hypothetical protein BV25DRAFT_1826967 [Artomyces pyxidatus]|uniref:Uncharacterized protein n=1 Tax=Artomyces pyxidatus TaxID=48021 RepID=A0ACB8SYY6_9AGAM|nr:hypothetical protein BV25DRAFT_1826967 [Artomyces pyxidatus]
MPSKTRSKGSKISRNTAKGSAASASKRSGPVRKTATPALEDEETSASDRGDGEYEDSNDEPDVEDEPELDSDALDDDDEIDSPKARKSTKRTRSPKKAASPRKRRKKDDDMDAGDVTDLKEGQQIVGRVVQAPKSGRVPPGRISQNTFNFLTELTKPECNDREWSVEPVFRLAESEFKDFIDKFTDAITEVDTQIPPLPPKDVIYRIYRDVRFSNDKTPYKRNFSATFSRSGRKGSFAGFQPGGDSLLAAGIWCPGKNELATIRTHIQHSSARMRKIIAEPSFVKYFGAAKPHPQGKRQNIYGSEDQLKTAPKGIDKTHKDIDLLKCRSFTVVHRFKDEQVLRPDFIEEVMKVVKAVKPLVYCLNDYMTLPGVGEDEDEDEDDLANEGDAEDADENEAEDPDGEDEDE